MKKILMGLVAMAAVMSLATSAVAQGAGPKTGGQGQGQGQRGQFQQQRQKMQEEILKKLNLTAAQKTKWDATTKQMRAEMDKIRADAQKSGKQPDRQQFMTKMKGWNDKLMAILTPKQKTDYEKYMKEVMEKARQQRGGQGGRTGGGAAGGGTKTGGGKTGGGKGG